MNTQRSIKPLLLLAGLLTALTTLSQEYNYIHYDVKDGLAGSTVYDVCQDKDGFIWFATEAGVSRFDGTNFKNFGTADGLPDIEILKLYADSKGRVWMAPLKNTICYYYNGKIYNQQNSELLKKIKPTSNVIAIYESADHAISLSSDEDVAVVQADSTVHVYDIEPEQRQHFFINSSLTGPGFAMANNTGCFLLLNGKTIPVPCNPQPLAHILGMHKILKVQPLLDDYTDPVRYITFSSVDNGTWMADTITHDHYTELFLPGKRTGHTIIDREKNIWFATLGEGVYKLPSREIKTWFFKKSRSPEIFSITKLNDKIYAGSGYSRIYKVTGSKVDSIKYDKEFLHALNRNSPNRVVCLITTKRGKLVAAADAMLISETETSRTVNPIINSAKSVDEMDDGSLLVGTSRLTMLLNPDNLQPFDTIWNKRATAVCYYNNEYYIGTVNGLYVVSKDKKARFLGNSCAPLTQRISHFAKSPDGTLWVSTFGGGIVHMKNGAVINLLTTAQGIASNSCRTLFLNGHFLWVGTDKGLNKINLSQTPYSITVYNTTDGLPTNIISAVYVDGDKVYVGTPTGLTVFDETRIINNSQCNLRLLDVSVGGQSQPLQNSYELNYYDNSLKISYAGISFKSGGDMRYRYRLHGADKWDTTAQTILEYPSLSHGSYEFELTAFNKKGVISNTIKIPIVIKAAFWQTLPFQILVIAIAILITWLLVAWRFSILRKAEKQKVALQQRLNDLEQMALRAQMNPHFIFNCLNSIQNFIINNDLETTNWYLTGFAHLIRQTLDNSEKSSITITNEINYLKRYLELEMMRFRNSFHFTIEVDPDIDPDMVTIPTMILQPYIENSIRHGIRYKQNGEGRIDIKFLKSNSDFVCIIEDNGIGRKKASDYKSRMHVEYQSKGMSLTAERINILNRELTDPINIEIIDLMDDDNQPAGTKVVIRFPEPLT